MPADPSSPRDCPCGRRDARGAPLALAACCGPFLAGAGWPPDPESLMRSRYSAFVLGNEPWLLASWHPGTRPASVGFEDDLRWLGLDVRTHRLTGQDRAEVEFVARSRPRTGPARRLHERSRFLREQGRWFYVDGDLL